MADKEKKSAKAEPTGATNEAAMQPVPDQAKLVAEKIGDLTREILGQAETLRSQVQDSEIQRSLRDLRGASAMFQTITEEASSSMMTTAPILAQREGFVEPQSPRIMSPHPKEAGCGCGSDCGGAHKPKCCIELYMSKLDVIDGQGIFEGTLELIAAVQAGDTWGLAPGLSTFYSVRPGSNGIKLNDPIARFCVPCDECLTVPLHVEVMEVAKQGWLNAILEARLEVGSAQRTMTLRCDCHIAPVAVAVGLTPKEKVTGVVEVEISARRINGGCC